MTHSQAENLGKSYIGRRAQSSILTMISNAGGKVAEPQQEITGYEVVPSLGEHDLMLIMGGESVYESTLFNIS